jgi:sugar O-acyltransferase (sialic acid O-acetyltransferase NeuD family)
MPREKIIPIVIIGASGFGKEVAMTIEDCIKNGKNYELLGFIDDDKSLHKKNIYNYPVLGGVNWLENKKNKINCVVAIGNSKSRKTVVNKIKKFKIKFQTIIHPSTIISNSVKIGNGCIIQPGSIITVDTKIGDHVIINIKSTIGHDDIIENFVTINPGVHVNGNTKIETGVDVGSGTTMKQGIKLGKWSIIGAGSALITDVEEFSLYVGVPGKLKKKLKEK